MDSQYEKLNIDSNEKELILFKSRFDTVPSGSNRMDFIQKERSALRKQIDQLNAEAIQMETNLSFFSRSKGADNLRKEVDQKVGVIQQKIEVLKRKLKAIPSE
jgi:predicted  nucleic acid-binding Zn-ribbon protein